MTARRAVWLAARSLLWAILLPGVMAGYIPWRFLGLSGAHLDLRNPLDVVAFLLILAGLVLLVACILEFARSGRGTLAPVDPPTELVVQGLYRFVRNPMYLSVATILLGECILTRSRGMPAYAACWYVAVNLFVLGYEEPALRRQFGASYEQYHRDVNRWIPSIRPPFGRAREVD